MEEDTHFIDPDWLPNGSFPESTSKKLFIYFIPEAEDPDEVIQLIHKLELQSRIYAGQQQGRQFSRRTSGDEIREILEAMKTLSQKIKTAHQDTHQRIMVDVENFALVKYKAPRTHNHMNIFIGLEGTLNDSIMGIERGRHSKKAMECKTNSKRKPQDHDFVFLVTKTLESFLKMQPTKAQIHKTISIILNKKDALKQQINYPGVNTSL